MQNNEALGSHKRQLQFKSTKSGRKKHDIHSNKVAGTYLKSHMPLKQWQNMNPTNDTITGYEQKTSNETLTKKYNKSLEALMAICILGVKRQLKYQQNLQNVSNNYTTPGRSNFGFSVERICLPMPDTTHSQTK